MRTTSILLAASATLALVSYGIAQSGDKAAPVSGKAAPQPTAEKIRVNEKAVGAEKADVAPRPAQGKPAVTAQPAAPGTPGAPGAAGAPGAVSAETIAKARAVARQMMTMEQQHRELQARLDRLLEVFAELKQPDKSKEVQELRAKDNQRYKAAMDGYKAAIGPDLYAKVMAAMNVSQPGKSAPGATRGNETPEGQAKPGGQRRRRGG